MLKGAKARRRIKADAMSVELNGIGQVSLNRTTNWMEFLAPLGAAQYSRGSEQLSPELGYRAHEVFAGSQQGDPN
jgi:hypothetical protein